MMSAIPQELRFALRGLARRPGSTAITLLALIPGVGANAASEATSNLSPGDLVDFQRGFQGVLFGVTHLNPAACLIARGALITAGLAATLVPARRALGMNPAVALSNA